MKIKPIKDNYRITETWRTFNEHNKCIVEREVSDSVKGRFRYTKGTSFVYNEKLQCISEIYNRTDYHMITVDTPYPVIKPFIDQNCYLYEYDDSGNLINVKYQSGRIVTSYKYDEYGNQIERWTPFHKIKEVMEYDDKNHMTKYHHEEGDYSISDAILEYDKYGNEIYQKSVNKYCDTTYEFIANTSYTYDQNNNIIEKVSRNNNDDIITTKYTYDEFNRLIHSCETSSKEPDMVHNIYHEYDGNGNQIHTIEFKTDEEYFESDDVEE